MLYDRNGVALQDSPLNGKKWMVFGDSTSCYGGINYPDYIKQRTNCTVYNRAKSGHRMMTVGDSSSIAKLVADDITEDVQLLTLIGGYNDRRTVVNIPEYVASGEYREDWQTWEWCGTLLNADGTPNLDHTTLYGAYNYVASKWYEVCPSATKVFFTILPCHTNPNGEYETKINGIIKEVAAYWCIPCFDAWNEVGLPVRLDHINETYYMNDRIHPNPAGNEIIARYIQAKIESVMR